ncbi:28S ribosomal S21, mitochondrial, partial [Paramuricea clavata]
MAHHLFRARTIIVGKKGVTDAMNSLQRVMQNEKQIKDIQLNRYYEKPTVKRRRKKYESKLRIYNAEMDRKIGFLSKKDRAQFEKVPKNDALSYLLEILPSRFGRKPERLHSTARVIEYVPSSNPDSPPPSFLSDSHFDLEEEIVRDVCDYLSRHEVDVSKHDLPYSSNTEEWQLEEMVMKDCFEEFLRRIPRFQDLALRLKPRKVTDPFVGKDGCLRSECRTICSRLYCDQNLTNISIVGIPSKESFVKLSISEQTETEHYKFASPLIGSAYSSHDAYIEINYKKLSPIPEQSSEVILEHNRYFKEINIAVKDVSSLVLESPPPCHRTEHKENVDLNTQDIDHLEPCQLHLEESVCVFSPRSQKKTTQEVEASSRLPDKISSLMLVVPDVDDSELVRQDFTRTLSTLSKETKEDFQSELELQLHWDPLHATPEKNINQLRFTTDCKECSAPESPLKVPTFASELKVKLKKMPWGNVYVSGTDASPLALELTKPSPLVPCMAKKENFSETNTSIPNSTRSKSSGKVIVGNAATCSSIRTSEVLDDSKKYNNIHSGIDDFVLLRTGMKSSSRCPPKAIVKAMKVDQRNGDQNDDILTKMENFKDHAEVVDASLAGELQTAYNYIENYIRPCLLQLQEAGCVASSYTTSNLTADYTRFVLKQEERKKSDIFSTDQTCDVKRHKMLICLHVFVTTAELIRECGITVAQ